MNVFFVFVVCAWLFMCMRVSVCVRACTRVFVCVCVCPYARARARACVCAFVHNDSLIPYEYGMETSPRMLVRLRKFLRIRIY